VFQEAIKTDEYDPVMDLLGPGFHVTHQARREADAERYATAPTGFSTLSPFYGNEPPAHQRHAGVSPAADDEVVVRHGLTARHASW
jgi:hypothetical protein